jgi:hypothetical protein
MSKTIKHKYTGSKAIDPQCVSRGKRKPKCCDVCRRTYEYKRKKEDLRNPLGE